MYKHCLICIKIPNIYGLLNIFLLGPSVTESKHSDYIHIKITESIENDLSSPLKFATITSLPWDTNLLNQLNTKSAYA